MEWIRKPSVVAAVLAVAVAVMLHGNLRGPFHRIDDIRYVPHSVEGAWTDVFKLKSGFLFAPVTYLSLRLDCALFGPPADQVRAGIAHVYHGGTPESSPVPNWAWAPRLMNGIYHGLAGFFLWLFLTRVGAGAGTALLVSFVWTAHPAALESVAWVCERKSVLCALLGFAALVCWAGNPESKWRWVWVSLFFGLSLLSKMAAVSFVPILVALELFDPRKGGSAWRQPGFIQTLAVRMSFIVLLTGVIVKIGMGVYHDDIIDPPGGSAWTGLLTDSEIFFRYTVNSLAPFWLSFFHGVEPVVSLGDPRLWIYGGLLAGLWLAMYFATKQQERYWILIGGLWFFGGLGPNANLIASAFPIQDRYMYLPMPGLLIAVVFAARGLHARTQLSPAVLKFAGVGYALFILTLCGMRSPLFHGSSALFLDAARRQPQSGFAQLSAAWTHEGAYQYFKPGGPEPDIPRAQKLAEIQLLYYSRALQTNDFWMFNSPTVVRTQLAEVLLFLDRDADSVAVVAPHLKRASEMVPPVDPKKLYPELPDAFKYRFHEKTDQAMMERGWLALSESFLKLSYRGSSSPEQREAHARSALEHAQAALEFTVDSPAAMLLKGNALIRLSYLAAARDAMPEALKLYVEARGVFAALPIESAQARQAELILKNVPPPEAPKNVAPPGVPANNP